MSLGFWYTNVYRHTLSWQTQNWYKSIFSECDGVHKIIILKIKNRKKDICDLLYEF